MLLLSYLFILVTTVHGGYVVTVPRKWTSGSHVQVCVFLTNDTTSGGDLSLSFKSNNDDSRTLEPLTITVPNDKMEFCDQVTCPTVTSRLDTTMQVTGDLGGHAVNQSASLTLVPTVARTFVQTDKFLYKPGQTVQFRILTVTGPFLKISTEKYSKIWVETPSGSRIAQWLDLSNDDGLIHLSLQLAEEPEQGTYTIKVKAPKLEVQSYTFKVEEYVLPRFEVIVTPPKYILASDKTFNYSVCAQYTYGQPVKGNVTFEVKVSSWHDPFVIRKDLISGCKSFEVRTEEVHLKNIYYYNLLAKAKVVEEGTGVEREAEATSSIHRNVFNFQSASRQAYSKAELPLTCKVKASFQDESPAPNELFEVCLESHCKNMLTDESGVLTFVVPPLLNHLYPTVKSLSYEKLISADPSLRWIMYESSYSFSFNKLHTPTNSSLLIYTPDKPLPCIKETREHIIPVLYASANQIQANITVQVVSRGQIQYWSTEQYSLEGSSLPINEQQLVEAMKDPPKGITRGALNIKVKLPPTTSPKAKVLVWYSRDDGEVVSDTQDVEVEECLSNDIHLSWSTAKVQPGEKSTLSLSAEPMSVCSLGVVDKSVELLSSAHKGLTLNSVFAVLEETMISEYENRQTNDNNYCMMKEAKTVSNTSESIKSDTEKVEEISKYEFYYYTSDYDALTMFEKSGLFIFSDLTVETRPCHKRVFNRPSVGFGSSFSGLTLDSSTAFRPGNVQTTRAPETALFAISSDSALNKGSSSTGQSQDTTPRTYFPETWLWQLSTVNATGQSSESLTLPDTITEWVASAVCVHPQQGLGISPTASITTFTPFFIDLTLPPSVKRGEILPVKISVFNYLEQDLPVKVILENSLEYEILEEDKTKPAEGTRSSCIIAQEKVVHTVRIRPTALGDVNITVTAFVDDTFPEKCGQAKAITKRDILIKPIKVDIEGFPREKVLTKYICTKDLIEKVDSLEKWRVETPLNIVNDSARGWVTAVGDLLGPTLENLGSLVRMPSGCGEQNMLNFAPNIYILQYLQASEQINDDIVRKTKDFMRKGYQRELNYRHKDGSYSAFGESDELGSTWLTAFVLKSFAQARPFIQIDEKDLELSQTWLTNLQMENGCFQSVGKVFNKALKGGLSDTKSSVPLAAYVLMALLEANVSLTSKVVKEASVCLINDTSGDLYTSALKTYALVLAGVPEAESSLENMLKAATETSSSMHWELTARIGQSQGVAVETAGYVLLAMIKLDPKRFQNQAFKIVKWISTQRNGQGGFVSTQDTVVALQALASFESSQDKGPLNVQVTATGEGFQKSFQIDEKNKLLQQLEHLPVIPSDILIDIEGEGCALIQAVLRYNVPTADPSDAFNISVVTTTSPDIKCVTKRIKTCASYHLTDGKSNMAVIEINLVSGYIPEKEDLKKEVGGLVKRYEVDGSKVTFYIDEFSSEDICVTFRIIREVDVEDAKPGTVSVYDYYEPKFSISKSYTLTPNTDCQ